MSHNPYDPKILEFLHFLAKNSKYMSFKEVSKKFKSENTGKTFTYRTILRWVSEIRSLNDFNYYPNINSEKFGFLAVWAIIRNIKNIEIIKIIPYEVYMEYGTDLATLKNAMFVEYFIPPTYLPEFYEFWKKSVEYGFIEKFEIVETRGSVAFYPPFHRVVDLDGNLCFDYDFDTASYMTILKKLINRKIIIQIDEKIRRNPVFVPVALTMDKEPHLSPIDIWQHMKSTMGGDIKYYFNNSINERGKCIYHIRKSMEMLITDEELVRQPRIVYRPFYRNNVGIYLVVRPKDRDSIFKISELIAKNSVLLVVSPPYNMKSLLTAYYFVTNPVKTAEIFEALEELIDKGYKPIVFWRNEEKSLYDPSKIKYWEVFDPVNVEWKYDHEKYMKELDTLSERQ